MAVSMKILQRADRLLGRPAFLLLRPLARRRRRLHDREGEAPVKRVLLVKFWGIGSLQLLTPAVRTLRERHPGASLELLTLVGNREFGEGLGVFDELHTLDVGTSAWRLIGRITALVWRLRRMHFDAVYDFEFFTHVSAVLSLLSGAPRSAGFAAKRMPRGGLHTEWSAFRRSWHVARNFRALAGGESGLAVEPSELTPFPVSDGDRAACAAALLQARDSRDEEARDLVVLNPNAGSLSLERRWPPERFADLARRLILEDGSRVVLIGAPSERGRAHEVRVRAGKLPPGTLVDLSGELSIGALCALFEGAHALVTNDSGPMHLAAALGTPVFGLFGPETPQMYRPLGARAFALWNPPACSPCLNVHDNKLGGCFRGRPECMTNLSVALVHAAVREELATGRKRALIELPQG